MIPQLVRSVWRALLEELYPWVGTVDGWMEFAVCEPSFEDILECEVLAWQSLRDDLREANRGPAFCFSLVLPSFGKTERADWWVERGVWFVDSMFSVK